MLATQVEVFKAAAPSPAHVYHKDYKYGLLHCYWTLDEKKDGPFVHYKYDESQHTYKMIAQIRYKAGVLHGDYYMETQDHRKNHGYWYTISYNESMTYENGEPVGLYVYRASSGRTIKVYLPAIPSGLHTVVEEFPEGWAVSKIQYTAYRFKHYAPNDTAIPIRSHHRFTETYDGFYYTWGRNGELRSRSLYKKGDCLKTESFEWQEPARDPYEERLDTDDDTVYDEDAEDDW